MSETPAPTPAAAAPPEKKPYAPPTGATQEKTWRAPDGVEHRYTVTSEWLVLRKREQPAAEIFHTYYRLAGGGENRPITFVFNGGPGAASAYLHLGGLGPRRVVFDPAGNVPAGPAVLDDNAESWLSFTDLVFINPVGTGLSRAIETEEKDKKDKDPSRHVDEKEFYGLNRDLDSIGEFAQRFLSKHKLWDAPAYVAGESYGGFRTAKLARRLQDNFGIALSAVIAISPALDWSFLQQSDHDVHSYIDTFCSMALAAAWHGRSRVFSKDTPLAEMRAKIESFATSTLAPALVFHAGPEVLDRAADFLGLDRAEVTRSGGRIRLERFVRALLRDQQRVVGMYDATITGVDPFPDREGFDWPDPTLAGVSRLFASGINHWLRSQVGVDSDRIYQLLAMDVNIAWKRDDQKHAFDLYVGATDDLRYAMSMNPHMRVLITHGYYDLVTPYFSAERLAEQMRLLPEQRRQLFIRHFGGGHMFYSWESSRKEFRDWVREIGYRR